MGVQERKTISLLLSSGTEGQESDTLIPDNDISLQNPSIVCFHPVVKSIQSVDWWILAKNKAQKALMMFLLTLQFELNVHDTFVRAQLELKGLN